MNQPLHPSSTFTRLRRRPRTLGLFAGALCVLLLSCGAEAKPLQWEYRVINAGLNNAPLQTLLNSNGAEGWELIQITAKGVAVFKRPVRK